MTEIHNHNLKGMINDDLEIFHTCSDDSEKYFAEVIGCIEEIIMREEFSKLRRDFLDKYWKEFDDNEENKLVYTEIYKNYIEIIEKYIEEELQKAIVGFDMQKFETVLKIRHDEVDAEIFEMLKTFTDFIAFKTMFLDYKAEKEGRAADFSQDFNIKKYTLQSELYQ